MTCAACSALTDITDLSAPYVVRTCAFCGRKILLREPGDNGQGIKVEKGDQFVIPEGFLKISVNPLKGNAQLSYYGLSWFIHQVFMHDYFQQRDDISEAIERERNNNETFLKSSALLKNFDFSDPQQFDNAMKILKENENSLEWFLFWSDVFMAICQDAVRENNAKLAAWAMGCGQRLRSCFLFKDNFEDVVWMGQSARRLVRLIEEWNANKLNDNEEFWQRLLQGNSFAFSQMFSTQIAFIEGKAYVGGMRVDRQDAKFVDFMLSAGASEEAVLVEIKTPCSRLLGKKYRKSTFQPSSELVGSIVQIKDYKQSLVREYDQIMRERSSPKWSINPKSVILIGTYESQLDSEEKKRSFDLFRSSFYDIEIITFDEFFGKLYYLLTIFNIIKKQQ